jgi:hypothetical protein
MPETITKKYTVCKFSELSEDARQEALEKLYDINVDFDWWDSDYDDFKAIGKILGIDIGNIYFSGFASQGDGACFEGNYRYNKGSSKAIREYAPQDKELHRIADSLRQIQRERFYKVTAHIKQSGHYSHKYCTEITVSHSDTGDYMDTETSEAITETLRDFMEWIYRQLNKQYDYLTSHEAIIETIEANDYNFFENGRLFGSCC